MAIKVYENLQDRRDRLDPGFYFGVIVVIILLCVAIKCHGTTKETVRYDTILCKTECIDKIIQLESYDGKPAKYYAVYNDYQNDISDVIPVSKSVYAYIQMCEENKVKPQLGIKLRNGQISSIIKYKAKYIRRKK